MIAPEYFKARLKFQNLFFGVKLLPLFNGEILEISICSL